MLTRPFAEPVHRLWNRDLAACLNMLAIVRSLRLDGTVPVRFQRRADAPAGVVRRRRGEHERRVRPRHQ